MCNSWEKLLFLFFGSRIRHPPPPPNWGGLVWVSGGSGGWGVPTNTSLGKRTRNCSCVHRRTPSVLLKVRARCASPAGMIRNGAVAGVLITLPSPHHRWVWRTSHSLPHVAGCAVGCARVVGRA